MSRFCSTVFLLLIFIAYNACKKPAVNPNANSGVTGNAKAIITNTIPDSVYMVFSGLDITSGTVPHIIKLTLPPGGTVVVPRADLLHAYRYSYNWHTANYRYSNWHMPGPDGKVPDLLFDYYADSSDYKLEIKGQAREELLICLDGDGKSSTWLPIHAYNAAGTSVWDTMSAKGRNHSFVITRFHTVKHTFTDTSNKNKTTNLSFALDVSQPRMWLNIAQQADSYILTNDLQAITPTLPATPGDALYYIKYSRSQGGAITYMFPCYLLKRQGFEK